MRGHMNVKLFIVGISAAALFLTHCSAIAN